MRDVWRVGFARRHMRIPDASPHIEAAADDAVLGDLGSDCPTVADYLRTSQCERDKQRRSLWRKRGTYNAR